MFVNSRPSPNILLSPTPISSWKTDDDDYIQQEELFVLDTSRPLILHRWNSSTSRKDTDRNKLTKHTAPTVYTLDDVDDCINDANAKDACTKIAQEVKTCNLVINYDLQKSEDPDEYFLETKSGC